MASLETRLLRGSNPTSGWASNFPASPATGGADALGLTVGFAVESIGNNILAMQLSALEQDGKLNILSSPSITTLDNQKAIIESGSEVPYQTVEDGEVKIEFKKAVLSLEVTPPCHRRQNPENENFHQKRRTRFYQCRSGAAGH